mgnify:CR=1 FL=1
MSRLIGTINCKCISKNRDSKGNIINYTLQDKNGKRVQMTSDQIKAKIRTKELNILNLQIDTLGRLVDKADKMPLRSDDRQKKMNWAYDHFKLLYWEDQANAEGYIKAAAYLIDNRSKINTMSKTKTKAITFNFDEHTLKINNRTVLKTFGTNPVYISKLKVALALLGYYMEITPANFALSDQEVSIYTARYRKELFKKYFPGKTYNSSKYVTYGFIDSIKSLKLVMPENARIKYNLNDKVDKELYQLELKYRNNVIDNGETDECTCTTDFTKMYCEDDETNAEMNGDSLNRVAVRKHNLNLWWCITCKDLETEGCYAITEQHWNSKCGYIEALKVYIEAVDRMRCELEDQDVDGNNESLMADYNLELAANLCDNGTVHTIIY